MIDTPPTDRRPPRALRVGLVTALVGIAFLTGLVLMGYLAWRQNARRVAVTPVVVEQPRVIVPAAAPIQPVADAAALAVREAALAGQLATLEARTAAVVADAAAAGSQAGRAEALLVAVSARRQIEHGLPLGSLEEQLRDRFGTVQPRAVATVIAAGQHAVTLEDLRGGLAAIAPGIVTVNGDDWWSTVRHTVGTLVVLRKAGSPSPLPADRVARARRSLEAGQVEAARAEVARLPGAAQAASWMASARRYVVARQALDVIETAAIMGQVPPTPPAPLLPTTTATPRAEDTATPATGPGGMAPY